MNDDAYQKHEIFRMKKDEKNSKEIRNTLTHSMNDYIRFEFDNLKMINDIPSHRESLRVYECSGAPSNSMKKQKKKTFSKLI